LKAQRKNRGGAKGKKMAIERTGPIATAAGPRPGGIYAASRRPIIQPKMVTSEKIGFRLMERPLTVEMFRHFVFDSGYAIEGNNANYLAAIVAGGTNIKDNDYLPFISPNDLKAFVAWRQEKTGHNLRIPTLDELGAALKELAGQLTDGIYYHQARVAGREVEIPDTAFRSFLSLPDPTTRVPNIPYIRLIEDK
jgi:hypothetical protein